MHFLSKIFIKPLYPFIANLKRWKEGIEKINKRKNQNHEIRAISSRK